MTPTITLEPAVTMGDISDCLTPLGFALEVNVEMESITVGGVALGFGMEVNSHLKGFFQETVLEYEIVSSTGDVIKVDAESDPDLFYALPWSCGSLGFLTALKIKIQPIKKYVHMRYKITRSPQELCDTMTRLAEAPDAPHFLEATIFDKDTAVLQMGDFADATPSPSMVNGITGGSNRSITSGSRRSSPRAAARSSSRTRTTATASRDPSSGRSRT